MVLTSICYCSTNIYLFTKQCLTMFALQTFPVCPRLYIRLEMSRQQVETGHYCSATIDKTRHQIHQTVVLTAYRNYKQNDRPRRVRTLTNGVRPVLCVNKTSRKHLSYDDVAFPEIFFHHFMSHTNILNYLD